MVDGSARSVNRDAEKAGSPYRYRVHNVPGGSWLEKYRAVPPDSVSAPAGLQSTTADSTLQKDILTKIGLAQQGWGDSTSPVLLGVQPLGTSGGSIKEAWFVKQNESAIRYEITLTPGREGVKFQIVVP